MEQTNGSYRDLRVWHEAMDLAVNCHQATLDFPREELFGLTSQIRRSAASVPANIAEGYGRELTGSYIQSLRVAQGSLKELETHVILAQRISRMSAERSEQVLAQCEAVGKMLRALLRALQRKADEE